MYIEETEAEEILSKDKLIDSICNTINNFNSKDIGNENFNLGFRYAIYKVSNLFEEKDKEIERLIAESTEWESKCYKYQDIMKEVREILKYHLSNPSGTKNGWHIDIWNSEDISKLNEDLEILDKENI